MLIPQPEQPDTNVETCYAGDYNYATAFGTSHYATWTDGRKPLALHFTQDVEFAASPIPAISLMDADGDGHGDILFYNTSTANVVIWEMSGAYGVIKDSSIIGTLPSTNWQPVDFADFGGDGKSDILLRNQASGDVALWEMDGFNVKDANSILSGVPAIYKVAGVCDFNGDGYADILWRDTNTGDVIIWLMQGARILASDYLYRRIPLNYVIVGCGDLNGDGFGDIVWRDQNTGDVILWELNGFNIIGSGFILKGVPLNYHIVGIGDINADHKADLIWYDSITHGIIGWEMNGAAIQASALMGTFVNSTFRIVAVNDANGDGYADLTAFDTSNGNVSVVHLNGLSILASPIFQNVGTTPWVIKGHAIGANGSSFAPSVPSGSGPPAPLGSPSVIAPSESASTSVVSSG